MLKEIIMKLWTCHNATGPLSQGIKTTNALCSASPGRQGASFLNPSPNPLRTHSGVMARPQLLRNDNSFKQGSVNQPRRDSRISFIQSIFGARPGLT